MKKSSMNAFRNARMQNSLRWLVICCLVFVVGAGALLASLPENRQKLFGRFEKRAGLQPKAAPATENEAGLQGTAVVNGNLAVRPMDQNDHLMGDISAPVQIIVYEDYQCPFCLLMHDALEEARKEFGGKLVIAVRNYPLITHDLALPAAMAAECAAEQGKYEDIYQALFAANKAGKMSLESLRNLGGTLKLDEAAYGDCLTKEKYKDKILAEKEEVKKLGVIGTPASFINGLYVAGAVPFQDFAYPDGKKGEGLKTLIQRQLDGKIK